MLEEGSGGWPQEKGAKRQLKSKDCSSPTNWQTLAWHTRAPILLAGIQILGPIFRRFHIMPWPQNGSLNVSGSCLTIFRCFYYINIDISILQTGLPFGGNGIPWKHKNRASGFKRRFQNERQVQFFYFLYLYFMKALRQWRYPRLS